MKNIKKILGLLIAVAIILSAIPMAFVTAETTERTAVKEVVLYEWDLTSPSTYWSVTGCSTTPLTEYSGSNADAQFQISDNGSFLKALNGWPAYNTTGAASNVDLSDPTTKLVVEFESESPSMVFVKASFNSNEPDNKGTLIEKDFTGYYRYEKNISSPENKYVSLQLGVFGGYEATFKSAKIVKVVEGPRVEAEGATEKLIKEFSLAEGSSDITVGEYANATYDENGLKIAPTVTWVGLETATNIVDITDTSTKLVLDIDNPDGATVAVKYIAPNGFSAEAGNVIAGELLITNATGKVDVYLDKALTREQLSAFAKGGIRFQVLVHNTDKEVTIKSLKLVKTTAPVYNKKYNLSDPTNYWSFQGLPTSTQYAQAGESRPMSGEHATGGYVLDAKNETMSIYATEYEGTFWYGTQLNGIKINIDRNPKLKFTVVSSGPRWTLKITGLGDTVNLFNEYNNEVTGDVEVNLSDYYAQLTPVSSNCNVFVLDCSFMVLTNGDNTPTVIKDLRIEYENPDPTQAVTEIPETVFNTDTLAQGNLPTFLTVSSDDNTADIHVNWVCDTEYTPDVAGRYIFKGAFDQEELYNNGMFFDGVIEGIINVKEFMLGNVNNDDCVDVRDLVRLKKYLAQIEGIEIYFEAANLYAEDNEINGSDLVLLRQALLG